MSKISVLFSFTIKISVLFSFTIIAVWVFANCSESKLDVGIYELKRGDFSLKLTNWGATIVSLVLPDKHGKLADVVLGYDSIKDYMDDIIVTFLEPTKNNDPPRHLLWVPRQRNDTTYFGATVGRVANRIGGAQFTLNGTHYKLVANEGKNMLHGGSIGFSDVVWKVKNYHDEGHSPYITFGYHSFDGEEGFPGNLLVTVTYALVEQGMSVTMEGKALNKATPVNLAQHAYWNLGGHNSGDILSNEIQIFGSHITPVDKGLIPTGKIASVKGTPYDLLEPTTIASKINKLPNGYDINYVLDRGDSKRLKKAAMVHNKKSGRVMELFTNQPGMQFYTGNFIKDVKGKGGFVYQDHAGLCLETQGFPDSVNHPNFPSQIIFPGKKYNHRMLFKFSTKAT